MGFLSVEDEGSNENDLRCYSGAVSPLMQKNRRIDAGDLREAVSVGAINFPPGRPKEN